MQQDEPEDYVLATGITTSVRDFTTYCFRHAGIEIEFKGTGRDEKAFVTKCTNPAYALPVGRQVLAIHPRYFRPAEVDVLQGDASKAKTKLGWQPKYNLEMLVNEMMTEEIILQSKK